MYNVLNILSDYTYFYMSKNIISDIKTYFIPVGIYLLKVNNRSARTRCEICSKLTVKTPEQRHWQHSGVFIVNFEHIKFEHIIAD